MKTIRVIFSTLLLFISPVLIAQDLYRMPEGVKTGLSSFENMNGVKGAGGKTNKTAKGNAFESLKAGESKTLLQTNEPGIIQRMWFTIQQRDPVMLRSLRFRIYWDGDTKAAVDVPFGDFFVSNLGKTVTFQSALFSSPEGRSYNCYIPMPYRKSAKVVITNEGSVDQPLLFYDIDFISMKAIPADALYFHAYWTRQKSNKLKQDFEALPVVKGKGRFLGMSVGVNSDSIYDKTWWGEGEVKMYVDGDKDYPTINGTGTEDYIGTGWGLGPYANFYQGCPIANDTTRQYVFYRWHVPDAVYFNKDLRVTLQEIGGGDYQLVKELWNKKVPLIPISVANEKFTRLFELPKTPNINDADFPQGWVNFYRIDDYSAVSYFYLDKSSSTLPSLAAVAERTSK